MGGQPKLHSSPLRSSHLSSLRCSKSARRIPRQPPRLGADTVKNRRGSASSGLPLILECNLQCGFETVMLCRAAHTLVTAAPALRQGGLLACGQPMPRRRKGGCTRCRRQDRCSLVVSQQGWKSEGESTPWERSTAPCSSERSTSPECP
jgi:hypothetical protein